MTKKIVPAQDAIAPPTPPAPPAPPATTSPPSGVSLAAAALEAKNKRQQATSGAKARQAAVDLRTNFWPGVKAEELWLIDAETKKRSGFAQVPRTLSMVMNIINDIAKRLHGKAVPAGKTYLVLWLHHFSEGLVKVHSETEAAYEAGYEGQRAVTTFRAHMALLKEIGFIDFARGPKGPYQYVLMYNPYKVLRRLRESQDEKRLVSATQYAAIIERVNAIGARDELEA